MAVDWDTNAVVSAFADAAVDSTRWDDAIEVVTSVTDSFGACLLPIIGEQSPLARSESLTEVYASYQRDGWASRDERFKSLPALKRRGAATELDFVSAEEMARNAYWQEWLAPFGLKWFAGVGIMFGGNIWCLSLQRSVKQGPFDSEQVAALAGLSSHLSSAGALASAMNLAKIEGALSAFEMSNRAVLILDRSGAVVSLNDAARRYLGAELQVAHRRIFSADRSASKKLHKTIELMLSHHGQAPIFLPPIALPRESGNPLFAYVSRPSANIAASLGSCACIVTLVDIDDRLLVSQELLVEAFGLTKAEARLCVRVGSGLSLETAAGELDIAYETARTQLRALFAKVGVNRQAELAAMVSSLAQRTPPG